MWYDQGLSKHPLTLAHIAPHPAATLAPAGAPPCKLDQMLGHELTSYNEAPMVGPTKCCRGKTTYWPRLLPAETRASLPAAHPADGDVILILTSCFRWRSFMWLQSQEPSPPMQARSTETTDAGPSNMLLRIKRMKGSFQTKLIVWERAITDF